MKLVLKEKKEIKLTRQEFCLNFPFILPTRSTLMLLSDTRACSVLKRKSQFSLKALLMFITHRCSRTGNFLSVCHLETILLVFMLM